MRSQWFGIWKHPGDLVGTKRVQVTAALSPSGMTPKRTHRQLCMADASPCLHTDQPQYIFELAQGLPLLVDAGKHRVLK